MMRSKRMKEYIDRSENSRINFSEKKMMQGLHKSDSLMLLKKHLLFKVRHLSYLNNVKIRMIDPL
jgi:hypothetical protein